MNLMRSASACTIMVGWVESESHQKGCPYKYTSVTSMNINLMLYAFNN